MLAIAMIVARSNSSRVRVRHSGNFQEAVTCVNQLSRRSFANRFREGQGAPFDRTGIFQFTLFNALTEPILFHGLGGVDLSQGLIPAVPGEMSETDWRYPDARFLAYLLNGRQQPLLIMLNGHHEALPFAMPKPAGIGGWQILINTLSTDETAQEQVLEERFSVPARSLVVMSGIAA